MNQLGLLLIKSSKAWKDGIQSTVSPSGLTLPSYLLLQAIYTSQFVVGTSPTQKSAAELVNLDLTVVSQTVKFLLAHRYINREPADNDSRAYNLSLTLAGEQLIKTSNVAVTAFEAVFFSDIQVSAVASQLALLTYMPAKTHPYI